jgi:hypothetical protein
MAALCAAALSLVMVPATAMATSTQSQIDAATSAAVEYIRAQQDPVNGELSGFGGDLAATALATAGVSAADVHGVTPGSPSLQEFLLGEYASEFWAGPPEGAVTDYERVTLVAHAAGLDPARLSADSNLPAQIAGRWNPAAGSFGEPSTNSTVFGILALKTAPVPAWALEPALSYLRQNQHDDDGWNFGAATTAAARAEPSDPEMTGAAVAALCEAGVPAYDPDVVAALSHLHGLLVNTTGGIQYPFGENSDTTAWVVSGLNACGIDPQSEAWTTPAGKTPIDHLLSLQLASGPETGGFGYQDTSEANLYSTQDALRALAGGVFAAAPPARTDPSLPRVHPVPAVATGTPVPHVLIIGRNAGNVRFCKLTAAADAPLPQVLSAAESSSYPPGCVNSFSVAEGQIDSINGVAPANQDEAWLLRLDRGSETLAGEQPVGFGDVISLRLGQRPANSRESAGSAGQAGPGGQAGPAGRSGPRGKRGARGKPGRNARIACRSRRHRAGKRRVRCTVRPVGRSAGRWRARRRG